MANYGYLNSGHSYVNGNRKPRKCCGFSARFVHYFLFIFNFIFLMSGVLILVLTLGYGRPQIDLGETHLKAIQTLIPSTHLVNLIHYSMVLCGTAICLIALINAFIGCCSQSPDPLAEESLELQTEMPLTSGRTSIRDRYNQNANRINDTKREKSGSVVLCFFIFGLLFLFTLQRLTQKERTNSWPH